MADALLTAAGCPGGTCARYALESWGPGGALLFLLIVAIAASVLGKRS
jgi:hypothetical protein